MCDSNSVHNQDHLDSLRRRESDRQHCEQSGCKYPLDFFLCCLTRRNNPTMIRCQADQWKKDDPTVHHQNTTNSCGVDGRCWHDTSVMHTNTCLVVTLLCQEQVLLRSSRTCGSVPNTSETKKPRRIGNFFLPHNSLPGVKLELPTGTLPMDNDDQIPVTSDQRSVKPMATSTQFPQSRQWCALGGRYSRQVSHQRTRICGCQNCADVDSHFFHVRPYAPGSSDLMFGINGQQVRPPWCLWPTGPRGMIPGSMQWHVTKAPITPISNKTATTALIKYHWLYPMSCGILQHR